MLCSWEGNLRPFITDSVVYLPAQRLEDEHPAQALQGLSLFTFMANSASYDKANLC